VPLGFSSQDAGHVPNFSELPARYVTAHPAVFFAVLMAVVFSIVIAPVIDAISPIHKPKKKARQYGGPFKLSAVPVSIDAPIGFFEIWAIQQATKQGENKHQAITHFPRISETARTIFRKRSILSKSLSLLMWGTVAGL
jgi:hypothetical protein